MSSPPPFATGQLVAGVSMVKDEADVLPDTLAAMAAEVDFLVVADNGSTDGTRELLHQMAERLPLLVHDDTEPAYYQSRKMSALAALARKFGAEWVVPFDADERWYVATGGTVADWLRGMAEPTAVVRAELYDHVPTGVDPNGAPLVRMGWRRRAPGELPKVAVRVALPAVIAQGNHGVSYPAEVAGGLVVRHFPYRSPEQFVRKVRNGAAAYAATDLPDDEGAHWRQYGEILATRGEGVLVEEVYRRWFFYDDPRGNPELIYDPCP